MIYRNILTLIIKYYLLYKINIIMNNEKICPFCKKEYSTKTNCKKHQKICKQKDDKILLLKEEIKKLKESLIVKDEQINLLKSIIENQKPTVINNNNNYKNTNNTINYISNLEPINFEDMKQHFENNLSNKYIDKGVEGIAMFICDVPCENKFITSDYARKIVSYKTTDEKTVIDPKGHILLNTAIKQNADTIIDKAEDRYQYWKNQIDDAREEDIEPDKSDIEKKNKTKKLKTIAQKAKEDITFDCTDATNVIISKGMKNKVIVNTNDETNMLKNE